LGGNKIAFFILIVWILKSQEALLFELKQSNFAMERLQEQLKEGTEIEVASFKSQLASLHLNEVLHCDNVDIYDVFDNSIISFPKIVLNIFE
jgi:hypothetical protein